MSPPMTPKNDEITKFSPELASMRKARLKEA
jgi:hypothetical protein